jgi:shikimate dehydrogenase
MLNLLPAEKPTMYFIGVTTSKSSIMNVFPKWAKALSLNDAVIKGIDIEIHAPNEVYREVVSFIKNDPLSMGALVTTHKIDLYNAAKDIFDYLDPYALRFGELSCISKSDSKLCGHAKDPITSGMALEEFVPADYWKNYGGDLFIAGAGGSAISMGSYIMRPEFKGNYPRKIIISNRSLPRLEKIENIFRSLNPGGIEFEFRLSEGTEGNDAILAALPEYSLIVNATGLGKDRPGSPLSNDALFPKNSLVWEINYRGDLLFMQNALKQKEERNLTVEDGWMYFIFGWTQVIAEVFHIEILGERLSECARLAR